MYLILNFFQCDCFHINNINIKQKDPLINVIIMFSIILKILEYLLIYFLLQIIIFIILINLKFLIFIFLEFLFRIIIIILLLLYKLYYLIFF